MGWQWQRLHPHGEILCGVYPEPGYILRQAQNERNEERNGRNNELDERNGRNNELDERNKERIGRNNKLNERNEELDENAKGSA